MTVAPRLDPARIAALTESGDWRGVLLDECIAELAARAPDRVAVIDGERVIAYRELDRLISGVGGGLQRLGVGPADVVAWQLPSWWEAVVLHNAVIRIGAVSNPIVPIYRRREVQFILAEAGAKVFVVPQSFRGFDYVEMAERLRPQLPALEHVLTVRAGGGPRTLEDLLDGPGRAGLHPVARSANDAVVLLYTSGTTADPKGVVHIHNTIDHENRSLIALYDLTERDSIFMPMPVTHITGVAYGLHMPFMLGTHVSLQDVWEPERALELIERDRPGFMVTTTPFLHGLTYSPALAGRDVSSLRVFWSGGADVPPQLVRDAEERLGCLVARVYGSTEYPTATVGRRFDPLEKRATTDGGPIGKSELRIVDDGGVSLGPGRVGHLHVRGPEMFCDYLVPPGGEETFLPGGWFPTGDLAEMDADGYLILRGRSKDIILRGGENIPVTEVENLLFTHPAVEEVAVVAMPDPRLVEKGCAYVVPVPGATPTLGELTDFLRSHDLAVQKLPERLELVPELPKNPTGKVQKFKLRERIRAQLAEEAAAGREPLATTGSMASPARQGSNGQQPD
jgi:cyclohexanecarboxylate-CoA ligase